MPRRLYILAAVGLLVTLGMWALRAADRAAATPGKRRPPPIVVGRDRPDHDPTLDDVDPAEQRDYALVSCSVQDGAQDAGSLVARSETDGIEVARGDDERLTLALAPGEWTLTWLGMDRQVSLGTLDLSSGDVHSCVLASRWRVNGSVRDPGGRALPDTEVAGCGASTHTDDAGHFELTVEFASCQITARVPDGLLARESEPFAFSPFTAGEVVNLVVATGPVGGIGVQMGMAEGGVRVEAVLDDTPADDAGLAEGDLIVGVDGVSTDGWTPRDAARAISGAPGEVVRLDVERDGSERQLALRRERLESSPE